MVIIGEKLRTFGSKPVIEFHLWSDTVPEELLITGADIGRPDAIIAVGSTLETPEARFKMSEAGYFMALEW